MSNLRSSSSSGRNVNLEVCRHSKDGSVSTLDADSSDVEGRGSVKSWFKFLLRSGLFTVLLLAMHWSSSEGPCYAEWTGEGTNEVKVVRRRRMLHYMGGKYMGGKYNSSSPSIPGCWGNDAEKEKEVGGSRFSGYNFYSPTTQRSSFLSPSFSTPFNSLVAMTSPPPTNIEIWSTYEDGLRYLNQRAFRNMGNDFRHPNVMNNALNEKYKILNFLYSKLDRDSILYLFSFITALILFSKLGAPRLFVLGCVMGILYHIRRSKMRG
ncbi:hypothetical protein AK88_04310 [Plasmodium fragile]|uniref:Uncharacterized protein n=1 Tax=Plasmodium fragile TaxID=5857 RepID=A0A0D9QGD9_PLAFR|nr:uncharacterized protein AK88_04310 [Plasmodium fragile]KJP86053.1 hypothetical protein AK88_04310 [Plasmodium fragile]